jgi:microcystin-dependent protein
MPRNSSGVYVQPASDVNPPIAGTVIDPVAFAAALTDIANELTNSLDRLGRAPMQAALAMAGFRITNVGAPVAQTDAARLADFGTYLPPGAIGLYSQKIAPAGWAIADGSAISRTVNPVLFSFYNSDGLIYGVGDGLTTFNLPNYQGAMLRSWDNGRGLDPARVFGSYQADMFASHTHAGGTNSTLPMALLTGTGTLATGIAATQSATGGSETVGKNYACLVCIRLG